MNAVLVPGLFLVGAAALILSACNAMRSGKVAGNSLSIVSRSDQREWFWIAIVVRLVIGAGWAVLSVMLFLRHLH